MRELARIPGAASESASAQPPRSIGGTSGSPGIRRWRPAASWSGTRSRSRSRGRRGGGGGKGGRGGKKKRGGGEKKGGGGGGGGNLPPLPFWHLPPGFLFPKIPR